MTVLLALFSTFVMAAIPGPGSDTMERDYDFNALETIQIDNVAGKIRVTPMESSRVMIRLTKTKFSDKCTADIQRSRPELIQIRVDGPSFEECEADIDVQAPKDANLVINAGSGPVNVQGLEGRLEFRVGSGSVTAKGRFSKVEGRSGSGPVDVSGIAGGGKISVGNGPLRLKFDDDLKGDFEVSTGTGSAEVLFPKGSKIRAEMATGTGRMSNELGSYSKADFGISMKSGTGDLKVKSY